MTAQDLLNPKPTTLQAGDTIEKVADLFKSTGLPGFVVVNSENVVVGVVSKDDLFTKDMALHIPTYLRLLRDSRLDSNRSRELPYAASQLFHVTVADVMNQSVYFAHAETPTETITACLAEGKQTIVPVVSADNKFIGVVENTRALKILSGNTSAPQIAAKEIVRPVDQEIGYVQTSLRSKFSYIATSRARLWLSTTLVLFIIGFGLGIIFIVDPGPIVGSINDNIEMILEKF